MKTLRLEFPVTIMCRVFSVSRSGFYAWANGKPSQRAQDDARLKVAIEAVYAHRWQTCGALRMQPELTAQGFPAGRDRIVRLRRELALRCKQKRKFKATTNSNHDLPVADNLLYCVHDYQKLVKQFGMQPSRSRRGNCYDNAPVESFWGRLKNEVMHHQRYATRADAKAAIQEYIEAFTTASGATRASAMFRPRCSLKNSANSHGWLETRVSAIDSSPQTTDRLVIC